MLVLFIEQNEVELEVIVPKQRALNDSEPLKADDAPVRLYTLVPCLLIFAPFLESLQLGFITFFVIIVI